MANATVAAALQTGDKIATGGGGDYLSELWLALDNELINGTAEVDTLISSSKNGFHLVEFNTFGLWVDLNGSAPDVKIEIIQSYNDTAANYVLPNANSSIVSSLTATTPKIYAIQPTPMPYMRLRVTGINANGTDTRITAYLWLQRT